jgi:hypothetical protein
MIALPESCPVSVANDPQPEMAVTDLSNPGLPSRSEDEDKST